MSQNFFCDLFLKLSHCADVDIFNFYIFNNDFLSLENKDV